MLVFGDDRLVLLATPKTASTSIETALEAKASIVISRPPQMKHTTAQRYDRFLAGFIGDTPRNRFEIVALMREPRDWLGSWYRYRQRPEEIAAKSTRSISFDAFVQAYCQAEQPDFAKVGRQADFLCPIGHRAVDTIFRYDDMAGFVAFLERRLSMPIDLPRMNLSPDGTTELSDAGTALLRQFCARDFAIYDSLGRA